MYINDWREACLSHLFLTSITRMKTYEQSARKCFTIGQQADNNWQRFSALSLRQIFINFVLSLIDQLHFLFITISSFSDHYFNGLHVTLNSWSKLNLSRRLLYFIHRSMDDQANERMSKSISNLSLSLTESWCKCTNEIIIQLMFLVLLLFIQRFHVIN